MIVLNNSQVKFNSILGSIMLNLPVTETVSDDFIYTVSQYKAYLENHNYQFPSGDIVKITRIEDRDDGDDDNDNSFCHYDEELTEKKAKLSGILSFPLLTYAGKYSFYNMNNDTNSITGIDFPSLEIIQDLAFTSLFEGNETFKGNVIFPSLKQVYGLGLSSTFLDCVGVTSASFPSLLYTEGMSSCFSNASNLKSVYLPLLETVGIAGLLYAFSSTALESINLPSLKSIGNQGAEGLCAGCSNLKSATFPLLETIDTEGLNGAFAGCTSLTTISFPSLANVESDSLDECFSDCEELEEIHFRKDMEETIMLLDGFDENFGAENATIYFDL